MPIKTSKPNLVVHKDTISLTDLREAITLDVSAEKGDVISIDMYGPEKIHPDGHFAYWNFKLPPGQSAISAMIDLNRVSFHSVVLFRTDRKMTYSDHWINPEFEFAGKLNIFIIIWRDGKPLETATFKIALSDNVRDRLQQSLGKVHRLDSNRLYISHFCNEEVPLPKLLVIESTSRCNLKCPMCPRTIGMSPSGNYGDLDETILANLTEAIRNTNSICLSWMGEPLLNKNLSRITEKIMSINPGVLVSMTSNGALLSEETAMKLINGKVDSINFSIDAADPELYSQARVGAELKDVTNNIRTLNRLKQAHNTNKPATGIAFVAGTDNIHQMPKIVELAAELEVKNVSLAIMDDFALTDAYRNRLNFQSDIKAKGAESLAAAELAAKSKNINLIYAMPLQLFHFLGIKRDGYCAEDILFDNDLTVETILKLGMQKGCHVPWMDSFIAHNGDVHPCCVSPRVLGNLKENTFEEIWNGEKYRSFRRKLKSCDTNEECRRCNRAIWNKTGIVESARDWMEVGRTEIHGLGWDPVKTDSTGRQYRQITGKATFFIRNSGKPFFAITLGNERRKMAAARISINNVEIGTSIVPYGWTTEHFDISGLIKTTNSHSLNIQQELLALDEAQDGLFKIEIKLESGNMFLKIAGAWLFDEDEVDQGTKDRVRSSKSPVSRLLNYAKAMIKHTVFYSDKIKQKLSKISLH